MNTENIITKEPEMVISPISEWKVYKQRPLVIAGPCSAESEEQVFGTAAELAASGRVDLFRAGIARSGAYNRTLTPFGFQSERRTLWEAPETYLKVSPFMYADKIKEPILLIHGEADDNTGTFPIQSERMYQAIKGNGGNVRYVTLPSEAHGYSARESTEHVLWEMINWFEKYVKNAGS